MKKTLAESHNAVESQAAFGILEPRGFLPNPLLDVNDSFDDMNPARQGE